MAARDISVADPARAAALEFLDELFRDLRPGELQVRLWDGSLWRPAGAAAVTLVLKSPGALRAMFASPSDLSLGEAYIYDDFDIEGDIEVIFPIADRLFERHRGLGERLRYRSLLKRLPHDGPSRPQPVHLAGAPHSKERDRQAVTYHYDVGNDFYRLWLDRRMVYSCAYFNTPDDDLDAAQERKLDYICRKLRLRPGERLLDVGCGWGGLIIHAAANYGVEALGITLSKPQAEFAQERIREQGLQDRCRAEVRDYRELEGGFDRLVSVGMFEHVGARLLPDYFHRAWRLLRPGGVFLNHGIAESALKPDRGASFSAKYVFPDGELVPIHTALRAAEEAGWEVRDVESLREHYALTLHHWVRRLQKNAAQARQIAGEVAYRVWRLYMAGSAHRFRTGWFNLYQALLVKADQGRSGLPLTRADWYV
jgi:cyclopropane-fatty-acyl-phospholipid synthase